MAANVNPLISPDAYDFATIAGQITPGQAEVTGVCTVNNFEYWRGFGISNPQLVFKGREVKSFTLEIRMWDENDLDKYQKTIEPLLLKLPFKGRAGDGTFKLEAFSFSHPHTNSQGIRAVCPGKIPQLTQTDDGLWIATIELFPFWGQPKHAAAKPIAATDKKPTPEDAADVKIQALGDQVSALGKAIEKERGP